MFLDEHKIKVEAGKGGDGCVSFRREKFIAKGGPNGGDGGNGGDVIIRVDKNLNTLNHLAHKKLFKGNNGEPGKGKDMHGRNGEPFIISVPPGTMIFNEDKSQLLADLGADQEEISIAKGGIGGMGNARFVSSTNQVPRLAEIGEPGESKEIVMELKLIAEVGIIGLPSAGKSTLISVISNAKPKIAAYHFTTLAPNLGVVKHRNQTTVVADIPGLIEGASEGRGLGHQFLKHVSRTRLLIHVIDGSLPNPGENYTTIRKELEKFDKKLAKTEEILVINKTDIIPADELKKIEKELKKVSKKKEIFKISAAAHQGLEPLQDIMFAKLAEIEKVDIEIEKPKDLPILTPHLDTERYHIKKIETEGEHQIFHITGKRIEQVAIMTDIKNPQGLERMYHFIAKMGIQKSIERKGATFGDIIMIGEKRIPYRK
ncbi:GTPase ObgE [Candidatus Peregrinibacteria bacterium CG10_big_fil_rev_8_21_14_0_10_36_19]|nr:MAG: GTPase ObgE [Candidatus Peregrinibacteria bacterium CG10_big_fil_rev_8_21_14_0_10_36_19]